MGQKAIGQPKQKRSIATKNKIKQTARNLFAEKGYYSVTSNNIAAAAKVPIGSFYNYFGNKKGLLLELIKDFNEQFHVESVHPNQLIINRMDSKEAVLVATEQMLSRTLLSAQLADPLYPVIHALQFTEPDVLALSEEVRKIELQYLIQYLEQIHQFHPIDNIPLRARVIHSSAENIGLYIHSLGTEFDQELLIKELVKMIHAYIFAK